MSSVADAILQCPICSEDMNLFALSINHRVIRMKCCNQLLCQHCLYRHLRCMFDEGRTGQGRLSLTCPFGCGSEIADEDVRSTLIRANSNIYTFLWSYFLNLLMRLIRHLTLYAFEPVFYDSLQRRLNRSLSLELDMSRYEQWSLAVGLRNQPVMRCCSPGCDYQWITNQKYRKYKEDNEAKGYLLWYSPPAPDKIGTFQWIEPEYANIEATGNFLEMDQSDGRRMVCAKCLACFCGLCRRPWELGSHLHSQTACAKYRRKLPFRSEDTDFEFVAQLANARTCPGCSLRTQRSDGCNHMTCPCGYEWCYICERRWNVSHYSCVDHPVHSQSLCTMS
jgi:IBR domain, a half RING-finger domain